MPIDPISLRSVAFFHLLDDDELAELAAHIDEASYKANQPIFKSGDVGGTMLTVLTGKVETFVIGDKNERIVLDDYGPGEIFGELSLLDGAPRSANAVSVEPTRVFIIDRDDLKRLVAKKPDAALDIMMILGQRIRKTDALLTSRVSQNPNEVLDEKATFGERVADEVARFGGSWNFIGLFGAVMVIWIVLNMFLLTKPFDPAPFIGLNLILSMLAALQAPVIMMSQNRQDKKDRVRSELDYQVNLKAEVEVMQLHERVDQLQKEMLYHIEQVKEQVDNHAGSHAAQLSLGAPGGAASPSAQP